MTGPLKGVRVLDLSRFIAGPYAGQLLAFMGAEVIKVEEPGKGDPMRDLSKYGEPGMSAHFLGGNASKRSLTLNLKEQEGRDILLDLLPDYDVLIENFRPGVMERLGLGKNILRAANPSIIHASVTGFGLTGPWKDRAAYDLIAQAAGGGMSLTGWPGEKPVKMGVPVGDLVAGIYAALGIVGALYEGRGNGVDVSMMDAQISLLNYHANYYWISGEEPQPEGDGHPNITPYQALETATRPIVVAVYGDPFWPGFCRALEREDLITDARFDKNHKRLENKTILISLLEGHLKTRARDHWLDRLVAEGVPVAPLNSVGEALDSTQAMARDMSVSVEGPDGKQMKLLGNPIKYEHGNVPVTAPPTLGRDTDEILGFAPDRLASLRKRGII